MRPRGITKISTLSKVNNKCDSLKTTMPKSIRELLGVEAGDQLEWRFKCRKSGCVEVFASSGNGRGGGL